MAEGSTNFMKKLLTTGIIGTDWPKTAYLIVVIKNMSGKVIWKKNYRTLPRQDSSNQNHTESQMLKDQEFKNFIEKLYSSDETKEVDSILTSNYSPCKECADDLIKFYEDKESPVRKLTIRFAHPYQTKKDKQRHLDGLKDLHRVGITLEAMTEESWRDTMMIDKSWFDAMTDAKSSFEEMMNEEHWFDKVMKLFRLDPDSVRKRDVATGGKLATLLSKDSKAEGLVDRFKTLRVRSASD